MVFEYNFLKGICAELHHNASLSRYTTFRLGGACPCLAVCRTLDEMRDVVVQLAHHRIEYVVIGCGSNLLVSDAGVDTVVVRYVSEAPAIERVGSELIAAAGTLLDDLVCFSIAHGLSGLVFASGIYGTVGGALCGNAGAFGIQMSDILASVTVLDRNGCERTVAASELQFRYRHSPFKESGDIILSARFRLSEGNRALLEKEHDDILELRAIKLPNPARLPSAGSFFKNIECGGTSRRAVGELLENAGVKTLSVGGARVFEKHANIIVATDRCRAHDVYALSQMMQQAVSKKFNTTLEREVRLLGHFDGMPSDIRGDFW